MKDTVILNEVRIGKSIADLVCINGETILYEIKTELDNPDKLYAQIEDYRKAFGKIYVVTHYSLYYKYYLLVKNSNVGLIYLDEKGKLVTHKQATLDSSALDPLSLFKLLRKKEYTSLVKKLTGSVPIVPNTIFFKTCFNLIKDFPLINIYNQVFSLLKERQIEEFDFISSNETPKELKFICYSLNLKANQYSKLYHLLNTTIAI